MARENQKSGNGVGGTPIFPHSQLMSPTGISTTVPLTLYVLKPTLAWYAVGSALRTGRKLSERDSCPLCTYTEQVRIAKFLTSLFLGIECLRVFSHPRRH